MNRIVNIHESLKRDCLVNPPHIVRVSKFNEEAYNKFQSDMEKALNTGQSFIPIVIDSYGGEVYSLMGMVDTIENCPVPVYTMIQSKAMSCGSVLFACGEKRFISRRGKIMIHQVTSGGRDKISELEVSVEEAKSLNKQIYEILAEKCGKSKKYFEKITKDKGNVDWYIDADEALEHNLATDIGIPNMKIDVSVNISI
jgi:ATP-dependent Clp protease protease subunit